jgi:hypothetical protein
MARCALSFKKINVTHSSVKPVQNFIRKRWVVRWKEPKVQLALIARFRDWHQTSKGLANIKVNFGHCGAIGRILLDLA